MSAQSQEDRILEYLKQGKSLTPLEALNQIGTMRLGARIFDLKQKGYNISSELVYDNGKHFSRYKLIELIEKEEQADTSK